MKSLCCLSIVFFKWHTTTKNRGDDGGVNEFKAQAPQLKYIMTLFPSKYHWKVMRNYEPIHTTTITTAMPSFFFIVEIHCCVTIILLSGLFVRFHSMLTLWNTIIFLKVKKDGWWRLWKFEDKNGKPNGTGLFQGMFPCRKISLAHGLLVLSANTFELMLPSQATVADIQNLSTFKT